MNIKKTVSRVAEEYINSPIEFTVEADFQNRITEGVRQQLRNENALEAVFDDDAFEYTSGWSNYTEVVNYKETYIDHFREKINETSNPFTRVHAEVAPLRKYISENSSDGRIDIVVFEEQITHPVLWGKGSQWHHPDDFEVAIELKYIKKESRFPLDGDLSPTEIRESPVEMLKDGLNPSENDIDDQLNRLNGLPSSVDTYLILISNYDYLYRGDVTDNIETPRDENRAKENRQVGDAAVEWFRDNGEGTAICYIHPTGYEWITEGR